MDQPRQSAQPGLEVTSHYDTTPVTLEAHHWTSPSQNGSAPSHDTSHEQKILAGHGYESTGHNNGYTSAYYQNEAGSTAQDNAKRRRPWLLIVLGGVATFVLAGVVGGIAGWKITSNQNQEPAPTVPGSDGSTPSTSATKIVPNSGLAAVGYRYGTDITLHVWLQGPDSLLRRLQYMSIYQNWTAPLEVDAAPKVGSPFGASQFWTKPDEPLPVIPQAELFYIGSGEKILGVNWREGFTRGGLSDSVNNGGWTVGNTGTQMAAYWPSTILQASNGDVMEVFFNYKSPGFQEPKRVGITASPGSALAILPRETTHSAGDQTAASSARIIYRDTTGRLKNFDRSSGGQSLTSSGEIPVTVDSNFTMAAFAVARGEVGGQKSTAVNTWILYQDSKTGKISYVYENDSEGWKGPETDPVFEGADSPTHLACVTAASSTIPEVPLEAAHDLSHCFFQSGRKLKHVHFDGSSWTDMGFISIP
ncbi:hypothetical protein CGCS363_v014003 [Colletotrichum siamense]|uniref:uncharacterized protein n=1 Tax=Colletotrichum siamense TaxID=690259 RepID=UPI0018725DF6|nr:uncharacterized protein CGCS363_v014003 [Colletotrichum siamense]KAF5485070.1 hypothetical protein CGCS363_v014003 [Colletotrichum siamense]